MVKYIYIYHHHHHHHMQLDKFEGNFYIIDGKDDFGTIIFHIEYFISFKMGSLCNIFYCLYTCTLR